MARLARRTLCAAAAAAALLPWALPAQAQDIKERTIKFSFTSQKDHPQTLGAEKFAELVSQKSGKKLTGQDLWRRRARRRPAERLGRAGRHAGDDLPERRHPVEPCQGTRRARPALPVHQREGSRRRGRRTRGPGHAGQAGRQGNDRPGLLGAGLSQPDQQQAADHQGRGHRQAQDPRDPVADLHRHLQHAGRERDADAVSRGLRRARAERHRRPGEPGGHDPGLALQRGPEAPHADAPHLQPDGAADEQEVLGHALAHREEDHQRGCDRGGQVRAPGVAPARKPGPRHAPANPACR